MLLRRDDLESLGYTLMILMNPEKYLGKTLRKIGIKP
jgi:hypothetical protein